MTQPSNYPPGSNIPSAPLNSSAEFSDQSCLNCQDEFEIEGDGYTVIPIEVEAGNFCSGKCMREHREVMWQRVGLAELAERVRIALDVIANDLPDLMKVAEKYDPDYLMATLPLRDLADCADEALTILEK